MTDFSDFQRGWDWGPRRIWGMDRKEWAVNDFQVTFKNQHLPENELLPFLNIFFLPQFFETLIVFLEHM